MNDVLTFTTTLNYNFLRKEWKVIVTCEQTWEYSDYRINESDAFKLIQSVINGRSHVEYEKVYYTLNYKIDFIDTYNYCKNKINFCEGYLRELDQLFAAVYRNYYKKEN